MTSPSPPHFEERKICDMVPVMGKLPQLQYNLYFFIYISPISPGILIYHFVFVFFMSSFYVDMSQIIRSQQASEFLVNKYKKKKYRRELGLRTRLENSISCLNITSPIPVFVGAKLVSEVFTEHPLF